MSRDKQNICKQLILHDFTKSNETEKNDVFRYPYESKVLDFNTKTNTIPCVDLLLYMDIEKRRGTKKFKFH